MQTFDNLKSKAINAIKIDHRLIADVALEYGISRRKLYTWLNQDRSNRTVNQPNSHTTCISRAALKRQIKTLQTEVKHLKSELTQYLITERLVDGKILLEFNKRTAEEMRLLKVS